MKSLRIRRDRVTAFTDAQALANEFGYAWVIMVKDGYQIIVASNNGPRETPPFYEYEFVGQFNKGE